MKAVIYTQYGSPEVLHLQEVAKPTPKPNEVLVKVHSTTINSADARILQGSPFILRFEFGLLKPKHPVLGADIAGVVEAVGPSVTRFRVGDAVFGDLSGAGLGGFAEYAVAPETALAHKPANLTFNTASALGLAGTTALQGLRDKGQLKAGQSVLIYGASGGVGTFAVQIAKQMGATVTAVCSTRHVAQVTALGADSVIDYTRTPLANIQHRYDVVLAVNGYHSLAQYRRLLQPRGIYVMVGGTMKQIFEALLLGSWRSQRDGQTFTNLMQRASVPDLEQLATWAEAGQIQPVIDRCFGLADTAEAFRYFHSGQAKGKVIITMT